MGGLIEAVGNICQKELDRIAKEIQSEMIVEASKHKPSYRTPTYEAAASIKIEDIGTGSVFGMGRFIGADAYFNDDGGTHLYYMDQGNNRKGRFIYPKSAKTLALDDGSFAPYVRSYGGKHFIKKIADKYR